MTLRSWLFGETNGRDTYSHAMDMADEVTKLMRDRAVQRDPFKPVIAELLFHTHDPALIADAYEISQEARIYRGAHDVKP